MAQPDFSQIRVTMDSAKEQMIGLVRTALGAKGYGHDKIKVVGSDPLLESHIPCVGINRASDALQGDSIGMSTESWYDDATSKWMERRTTFFEETLEFRIWHTNADEREKLAHLLKGILYASFEYLTELGHINIRLGTGRDEQENNSPFGPLFWYSITLLLWNPLTVDTITADQTIDMVTVTRTNVP